MFNTISLSLPISFGVLVIPGFRQGLLPIRTWQENQKHLRTASLSAVPPIWGFPKIRGTLLGAPIIRTIVFWGLYWGPPILGNSQYVPCYNIVVSIYFSIIRLKTLVELRGTLTSRLAGLVVAA